MSVEFYITCHDCKKGMWAGCTGLSGFQFLYANQPHMRDIGGFLYEHQRHKLEYIDEHQQEDFEESGYDFKYEVPRPK
jgi:hypothetical protein